MTAIGTFVSHKWEPASDEVINEIVPKLEDIPYIKVYLDRDSIGYRQSINEFMNQVRDGMIVVLIVSEEYLRSANCMYEMCGLFNDNNNMERAFPVLLYEPIRKEDNYRAILDYWQQELSELLKKAQDNLDKESYIEDKVNEINKVSEIIKCLPQIYRYFNDINVPSIETMRNDHFSNLINSISERAQQILAQSQQLIRVSIQIPLSLHHRFKELLKSFKIDFNLVNIKHFDGDSRSDVKSFIINDTAIPVNAVLYRLQSEIKDDEHIYIHYSSPKQQLDFESDSLTEILDIIKYE